MRIISGLYGGRVLKSPSHNRIRPTSDRLREALFNIISAQIEEDTKFLDLCAGTGAIGIEALSRGCRSAIFVDVSRRACSLIEENLDLIKVPEEQTEVFCSSAEKYVAKNSDGNCDLIFYDPPYDHDYSNVLKSISEVDNNILAKSGILIVEHFAKSVLPYEVGEIRRWRILKQGETSVSFYEKN